MTCPYCAAVAATIHQQDQNLALVRQYAAARTKEAQDLKITVMHLELLLTNATELLEACRTFILHELDRRRAS
jgi:hypothetical protein